MRSHPRRDDGPGTIVSLQTEAAAAHKAVTGLGLRHGNLATITWSLAPAVRPRAGLTIRGTRIASLSMQGQVRPHEDDSVAIASAAPALAAGSGYTPDTRKSVGVPTFFVGCQPPAVSPSSA